MKNVNLIAAIAAISSISFGIGSMSAQESGRVPVISSGISPVTQISTEADALPSSAKKFLKKNYPAVAIAGSHTDFPSQNIEVTLVDGTQIEFTSKGKLIEIEAPEDGALPMRIVKNVLPHATFKHLSKEGYVTEIESITHDKYGYKVEVDDPVYDEIRYGDNGLFVAIYED